MSQSQSYDDENKPSMLLTLSQLKSTSKLQLFNDPQKGPNPYGLLSFVEHKMRYSEKCLSIFFFDHPTEVKGCKTTFGLSLYGYGYFVFHRRKSYRLGTR